MKPAEKSAPASVRFPALGVAAMPRPSSLFDFAKCVAYDPEAKRQFHDHARRQLRALAAALDLAEGDYDLRSNEGGIAVSGEITLHADRLYVQVSQSAMGAGFGILFRSCKDRRDYCGGVNNFAPLDQLHAPSKLARCIRLAVLV
jgi:hypothetical protein